MYGYKKLLLLLFIVFLSGCSVFQAKKQESVYDFSHKAQAIEVDEDDNDAIDVTYGGTNSSTASGARNSLGAAASGDNSDITGLSTPITIGTALNFVGRGNVEDVPISPSEGDMYITKDSLSLCDITSGEGEYQSIFIFDGVGWDCVGDGTVGNFDPDSTSGDTNDDDLFDWAVLADLTYGLATAPGSPVRGKIYPVNGLDVDPGSYKITSGPDTTYAFVDSNPDTITDSGSGFVTDGFTAGMRIKVSGSSNNDGYYTVNTVVAGTLTLISTDELTAESAGDSVTILGGNHYFVVYAPDGNYYAMFSEMGEWFIASIASSVEMPDTFCVAISDESTALTTGTAKRTFRMPYAMTLDSDGLRASVSTAPTGSTIIIDVNEGGTTIMSATKLSIDASEETSTTAASAAVISDTELADDAEITIDIDQIGSGTAGAGAKVCFRGLRSW